MKYGALIPAAGLSSRMGSFKPLIEINGVRIIDHVLNLFSHLDADTVVVVGGNNAEMLKSAVADKRCRFIVNADYDKGMFSSIQAGAAALAGRCDAFFLLPCDIPFVKRETLDIITDKFIESDADVCIPSYKRRGGHPPIFDWRLIDGICSYCGDAGMRGFIADTGLNVRYVSVDDESILMDLDTPQDIPSIL